MITKIIKKLIKLFRCYVLRDKFLLEVARWSRDSGDIKLRLSYPMSANSVVFDLGGYKGDFAARIFDLYACNVYVFEPVPIFYNTCEERFSENDQIRCFNFGLSKENGLLNITVDDDASSFSVHSHNNASIKAQLNSVAEFIANNNINTIDLMKINIEGGEFDVIPALIESGDISKVKYLQVQFHNFIENSAEKRQEIRDMLMNTHNEMWNYEFVWESWELKE